MDYLQLSFHGDKVSSWLSIYIDPLVHTEAGTFKLGGPGFADALVAGINSKIRDVEFDENRHLVIQFSNWQLVVPLDEQARGHRPDALELSINGRGIGV